MLYFLLSTNLSGLELFVFIVAYLLSILIALVLHEYSHAAIAYRCGDNTAKIMGRMTFNPMAHIDVFGMLSFLFIGFGWAKPVPVNPLQFRNFKRGQRLVSLSGISVNFLLAFIFSALTYYLSPLLFVGGNEGLHFIGYFLQFGFYINISYAIFNLLPIYPLDGFNFVKSFLKPNNKFVTFMERYGSLILIIFIITSAFDYFYQYFLYGIEYLFFGLWGLF